MFAAVAVMTAAKLLQLSVHLLSPVQQELHLHELLRTHL